MIFQQGHLLALKGEVLVVGRGGGTINLTKHIPTIPFYTVLQVVQLLCAHGNVQQGSNKGGGGAI